MLSGSDFGPESREFEPWPVKPRCVLGQNTELSQCLSPPRCINGNQHIARGEPDKMLVGNRRWMVLVLVQVQRNIGDKPALMSPLRLAQLRLGQTLPYQAKLGFEKC